MNSLHKKNMEKEMHMNIQIGDYEVDLVILDMGSDVNILTKQTWKKMGRSMLGWSPMQLHLANKSKVQLIGRMSNLVVNVEGMKTYADFDVIEVVDGGVSCPTLPGIGWDTDNMTVINFKKDMITFKNEDIRVIVPMDPTKG